MKDTPSKICLAQLRLAATAESFHAIAQDTFGAAGSFHFLCAHIFEGVQKMTTRSRRRRAHQQQQLNMPAASVQSCGCGHGMHVTITMCIFQLACVLAQVNDIGSTAAPISTVGPTDQPTFGPTLSFSPTSAPTVPGSVAESVTWASIRVTAMVSTLTMVALIILFEVGRRSYTLRDIFDRKRETRPGRTPPKLLSGAGKGPLGWLKYVGEYLFIDGYCYKEYSDYARQVQEDNERREEERASKRRERSRRKPHRNSLNWLSLQGSNID
jgi:hypothetical protein